MRACHANGFFSHTHAMTTHAMFAPYKSRVVSRGGLLLPLTYLPGTSVGEKITLPGRGDQDCSGWNSCGESIGNFPFFGIFFKTRPSCARKIHGSQLYKLSYIQIDKTHVTRSGKKIFVLLTDSACHSLSSRSAFDNISSLRCIFCLRRISTI